MSISDGFDPNFFRRQMEKTQFMKEELDGEVFIFCQCWDSSFIAHMIKVLFPNWTLNQRVNNYVSRQGKGKNKRHESTNSILENYSF